MVRSKIILVYLCRTIDFANPDVYDERTAAKSATTTLAVTQYPRYIIYVYGRTGDSSVYSGIMLYNLETMKTRSLSYGSSGFTESYADFVLPATSDGQRLRDVSASSVVVKNYYSSASVRQYVCIYY